MAFNWTELSSLSNRQAVYKRLTEQINAKSYGIGPGKWTLTELISERSNAADMARRIIEGVDQSGKTTGPGGMRALDGGEFRVKLRVLTRQACKFTKDGDPINYWDVTDQGGDGGRELFPAYEEKPELGDEVWVKGDAMLHHPDTGERLRKNSRLALVARKEAELGCGIKPDIATHWWTRYPVDADGCITVSYVHAVQLLTTRGKRLVLPEFTTGNKKNKDPLVRRLITNWQFEEVPPGAPEPAPAPTPEPVAEAKPKRTRKQAAPKAEAQE